MATHGTHDYVDDPRNADVLLYVNGDLVSRDRAVISVFDAGFILGDGVWEGIRVVDGQPAFLDAHLERLYEGATAIALDIGLTPAELAAELRRTLEANGMTDGVHVRLMVTRGPKSTPYQDPRFSAGPATIVMIPEYKTATASTAEQGIRLFTTHVRRGYPDVLDPKLNTHSKLNDITACIQAYSAGADEALMLDPARVRGDLQFDALLHRPSRRGLDVHRHVLPCRHHPVECPAGVSRGRNPRTGTELQPDRGL